uniref:RING-type domain-containing protein n=1 Tax=Branchiostoma floridae TaxID=7739 RepID=C3ZTZ5_BRAFL|eukprot:XP_002587870.1 hypothetical protein BRAFLDRAFT_87257 [Branchiostoma floridae]
MSFPETDSNSCSSASLSLPGTVRPTRKQSRFSFRHIFSRTRGSKSRRHNKGRDLEGVTMAISSVSAQTSLGSTTGIQLTSGASGDKATECPLCCTEYPPANFPDIATCPHRSCIDCLRQYLRIEITESRVNISCPECSERFHPTDMQRILGDRGLMDKYEEFMLRRCLVLDPDSRWCPAPDCGPSGCTFWGKKPWSRKKKILWQLGTLVGAPVGIALIASISLPAMIIGIPVYMGRKIHNKYENLPPHRRHLAVTGGVSLSILVAPVLAALTVGIGVPIMLAYVYGMVPISLCCHGYHVAIVTMCSACSPGIGVPIMLAYVYGIGVPIMLAYVYGIGVPIMLAYVYGVVPISLCRSGGCGVRTTQKGGVRFEFDDDNEATVGAAGTMAGENMSIGPGKEGNPSIGEGSLLSASSSQVERLGVLRDSVSDRDSASTMAIAGSLAGSTGATTAHRLEVQADVQRKRCSVSSESPSASLGDNASTVAMAGSLLNGIGASSYTLGGAVAGATILPLEGTPDLGGAVTGPAEVTTEPAEVTSEPAEVTSEPAEVTTEPAEVTSEPAEVTTEPAEVTTEPAEVTTEPAEVTTEPAEVTTEPAEVTTEPAEVTTEPAEVTTEPAEVTTEPASRAEVTSEPAEVTTEPAEVTSEPAEVTTEPAEVTTEPAEVTTEPAEVTTEPAEVTTEPAEV